jgi:serine/threonine protein kinase
VSGQKDPRLGRDVAIKVLPPSFSQDADRLRRFEQEARAAGVLNHPNIGRLRHRDPAALPMSSGQLEGETLRTSLSAGMSQRKAIDYALQIAHGLAAAREGNRPPRPEAREPVRHERRPRQDLDFGLAKLTLNEARPEATSLPTATAGTEPGVVLGTIGYVARTGQGKPPTRSDIFSFGAILYEMLSGKRAFHGDSAAERYRRSSGRTAGPLRHEPEHFARPRADRAALDRENPEQRFHSAHDVAFALGPFGLSAPRVGCLARFAAAHRLWRPWPRSSSRGRAHRRAGNLEGGPISPLVFKRRRMAASRSRPPGSSGRAHDLCGVLG